MSTLENKKGPGAEEPSNLAAANLPSGERPWEVVANELGRNFLGPADWRSGFNVDVGVVPPIPNSLTQALLNSDCPIEPGKQIKDTHILVLIPKMVNGEEYSALKLYELCSTKKGPGNKLVDDRYGSWKEQSWASIKQIVSEWVLISKRDPDPSNVSTERHFRDKNIAQQDKVHKTYYPEYREVRAVELMTAVLLFDLVMVNQERLLRDCLLRCEEPNASGGRVCVGTFNHGLGGSDFSGVSANVLGNDYYRIGRALARELKT